MGNVLSCQGKHHAKTSVDNNSDSDTIDYIPITRISFITTTTSNKHGDVPGRSELTEFSSVCWASLIDMSKITQPSSLFSNSAKQTLSPPQSESPSHQSWVDTESFTLHQIRMSDQSPSEILPSLFLGSQVDSMKDARLTELKVTHILSVMSGHQHNVPGCKLLTVAMADNGNSSLADVMNRSFGFIEESQQHGNKLLIHCHLGQNRSPTVVIAWLMTECNMSMHDAYLLVKSKRDIIHPHKLYIQQLREYEKQLYGVYSVLPDFLTVTYNNGQLNILHENWTSVQSLGYRESQLNEHSNTSKCDAPKNEHYSASKSDGHSVSQGSTSGIQSLKLSCAHEDSRRKSESVFLNKEAFLSSSFIFLPMSPIRDQGLTYITGPRAEHSNAKSLLRLCDTQPVNSLEVSKHKGDAEASFVCSLGTIPDQSESSSSE